MTVPALTLTASAHAVRIRTDVDWLPQRYAQRTSRIKISFRTGQGERRLYRRKKRLPPSQWAPKYRRITYGPLKGAYYDPAFMPHMNGIMDTAAEPCVREVTNCKAPQTGSSANWETFLANRADIAPLDALIVYPDRDTASKRCKDYLQPMFTSSPRLRALLTGVADDQAALRVKLQTMLIYMGWSGSVTSIGNVSVGILIVDELDKCQEYPSKKEASFESLVAERVTAYAKYGSIIVWNSTPTASPSRIVAKLHQMQVIFDYHVTCPDCGHIQRMEFARIDFNGCRDPQEMEEHRHARYICAGCGSAWTDHQRDQAVRTGKWYARDEAERERLIKAGQWTGQPVGLERSEYLRRHRPEKVGFHSPAWISPLNSLSKCAAAFLACLKDEAARIYFVTQIEADEYTHHQKQRKEDTILALCDDRPQELVPSGNQVAGLICGSDTQDNGHWFWIMAFGFGLRPPAWLVRAGFVDTDAALERVVYDTIYQDGDGNRYPVQLMVKDAMGHRTAEVYEMALRHPGRAIPYKGATGRRPSPYTITTVDRYPGTNKKLPGGVSLYTCDSHYYKDQLAAKLAIQPDDPGAWRLYHDFPAEYASHLCAEVVDAKRLWVLPGKAANHLWDCAFMAIIGWDISQMRYWQPPEEAPPPPPPKKPSAPNPYTRGRVLYGR
ncbi:MAG: terminase [Bacteroidia bacterium]|nr:terminase [Bacteroidia bacterium]